MNENIDLTKILKDCPKGTMLYSTVFGEVTLKTVKTDGRSFPIEICTETDGEETYMANGKLSICNSAECTLFPSKNQRDWSKFQAPIKHQEFKPFEKVLVTEYEEENPVWMATFYSHWSIALTCHISTEGYCFRDDDVLPYEGNEHLVGKIR